ncbi:hypothetical protein D9M68_716960 [compost metagenome]
MDEDLQLHAGDFGANLGNLVQRQLARQDHPAQALLPPELHTGPIHRIGLHRQVNRHLREMLAHQHDQPGVGHDQRIRPHLDHRLQVLEEGFQLGVMRRNVGHHIELLARGMGLVDTERQVGVVEFVVAHPQAIARLPGVDRIGAVGEGKAHVLQGAGGRQQFGRVETHGSPVRKAKPATLGDVGERDLDLHLCPGTATAHRPCTRAGLRHRAALCDHMRIIINLFLIQL